MQIETFWFIALVFTLTMYVVLDGFDLGVGILHLTVAKTDDERRTLFNAIGPLWDGNEVWLIAAGGVLFFAFPVAYASSFSGFYLPLMMILWLLMFRALAIEFRRHIENELWQQFWDVAFCVSSLGLVLLLGMALGNVLRGVVFGEDHFFFAPLWTDFTPTGEPGIIDWFTLSFGLLAVSALSGHGAAFVVMRTEGDLRDRAAGIYRKMFISTLALSALCLGAASWIHPEYLDRFTHFPPSMLLPAGSLGCFVASRFFLLRSDRLPFVFSCLMILLTGCASAAALFPKLLPGLSSTGGLDAFNASSAAYGLQIGQYWWLFGMALVSVAFAYLYFVFRGKVGSQKRKHY
ncbi:MAG TPA: cytochrome d ubiquinol oxidase subunit II [Leptospiraceae bacterium]|nr:cytochrome d ubiquinol oxidase subunit II [Leptospiraceae bacterium]